MSSIGKPILVAIPPQFNSQIIGALAGAFQLVFASTCAEAKGHLLKGQKGGFAMILAAISFDESRLFDLLSFVREVDHFDALPFVVVQLSPNKALDMTSVRQAVEELGAVGFVQLHAMPEEQAAKALLDTVLISLAKPVKYQRTH